MITRRQLVLGGGLTALMGPLSGCSLFRDEPVGQTAILIHNESASEIVTSVTVVRDDDGTTIIDKTIELGKHTIHEFHRLVWKNKQYTVEIDVEGGATETYVWPEDVGGPLHVIIEDVNKSNVIFAVEVG